MPRCTTAPAQLVQVDGVIYVVTDADVEPFAVAMAPFTCVLGEVGLADTQHIMDAMCPVATPDCHA